MGDYSETEDIHLFRVSDSISFNALDDFGGDVTHGPAPLEFVERSLLSDKQCQPKIYQFRFERFKIDDDVLGFHISVGDALGMDVV